MATLKVPHQVGDLGGYLKEQRESARLSLRQLATAAGVSNPYLSQIERGMRRPSAEVLQQIAKGLQISAEALFMRAGLLEDSRGLDVEVAIQSDLRLTARQKRVLLDIYATFRAENTRAGTEAEVESSAEATIDGLKPGPLHAETAGDDSEIEASAPIARKRVAAKAVKVARTNETASNSKQPASTINTAKAAKAVQKPAQAVQKAPQAVQKPTRAVQKPAKTARETAMTTRKAARPAVGSRTVGSRAVKSAASRSRTEPRT